MPVTLKELLDVTLQFRKDRDWKQFHNAKDLAITLMLEAAEVAELMQWRNGAALEKHLADAREDLADELSDVLHAVLLLAADHDIDLGKAYFNKMKKNAVKYPVDKAKGRSSKYTEL